MEPIAFDERPEMQVIGLEVRTSNEREADPATGQIGPLWQRFFQEQMAEKIPRRLHPDIVLGVYTGYESDHTGPYTLVIGAEVANLEKIPEGMVGLTIPVQHYLEFQARGPMPGALIQAWKDIWAYFSADPPRRRAHTSDFEWHGSNPEEVRIFVAVK